MEPMELKELLSQGMADVLIATFSNMFSMMPAVQAVEAMPVLSDDRHVIASVGFAGTLEGNLTVLFPENYAGKLVAAMLGIDLAATAQDVMDGTGEIVNILSGGLKTRLENTPYNFDIGIPVVFCTQDPTVIAKLKNTNTVLLKVTLDGQALGVILTYTREKDAGSKPGTSGRDGGNAAGKMLQDLL